MQHGDSGNGWINDGYSTLNCIVQPLAIMNWAMERFFIRHGWKTNAHFKQVFINPIL